MKFFFAFIIILFTLVTFFLEKKYNFSKIAKGSSLSKSEIKIDTSKPIYLISSTPAIPRSPLIGETILAAGDIECTNKKSNATGAAQLLSKFQGTILTLGDNVQLRGLKEKYDTCFDPTWGRHKDRIYPSVGNHEYDVGGAKPFFDYFGERAGEPGKAYYSFDLGDWHLIAVNTIIFGREYLCPKSKNMCEGVKEQWDWLKKDLEQNKTDCTLVFGHYPLFTSVPYLPDPQMTPLWRLLYKEGVDLILNGHAHIYERFSPQDPEGKADSKLGIREFTVGTGGTVLNDFPPPFAKNSEVVSMAKHGILKLILGKGEYEWEFLSTDGSYVDKGRDICH